MPKPPEVYWEDLCYDAQQCVEKSLKSYLVFCKINFRYVHDIGELLKNLKEAGKEYPASFNDAVILTGYAVDTKYPNISEPVTEKEYLEAVELAKQVYQWIEQKIEQQYKLGL